ncbi:8-oxo-dGTP diphosphatase [Sporothrix curviconia]|uniref:8-oxo-dGTP diphosphatase n=1 Tax=Sporothrix curviconia TaxID=1260050 RepID=A0ABP0BK25_9PEZI
MSSAGRLAVAEDQASEDSNSAHNIVEIDAIPSKAASDLPLTSAEVDKLAASIHAANGEPLEAPGPDADADSNADLDDDPDVPRASIGDDSYYWDPSTMAPLNARSAAAIARLRAFRPPPFPLWDRLPVSRRAAVLVLLYADRRGDLRVVLTMRAASLRNYSGHAAFPGGKADSVDETAEQIARREAWEEIGLPLDDSKLPRPFRIEHLCDLPYNLAKTELVVRPCVALLHAGEGDADAADKQNGGAAAGDDGHGNDVTPDEALIPKLDAKEVAAVFSAPFHNFLLPVDEVSKDDSMPLALSQIKPKTSKTQRRPRLPPGPWYEGSWIHWHEEPWRMHFFYVPVVGQRVAKPRKRLRGDGDSDSTDTGAGAGTDAKKRPTAAVVAADQAVGTPPAMITEKEDEQKDEDEAAVDEVEDSPGRYKVWGMTARIIVDAAKLAYGETPAFEHNSHFGDERIIEGLEKMGRLGEKKKAGSELTHEDLKEASKM